MSIKTAQVVNGEVSAGDWVIAVPNDQYCCLIGRVKGLVELVSDSDEVSKMVNLNYMEHEYSLRRVQEIVTHFNSIEFGDVLKLSLNNAITSPENLIRITHLNKDEIIRLAGSREYAEAYCNSVLSEIAKTDITEHAESANANIATTEICISAKEFKQRMKKLLPDASQKAINHLITYANELDADGTHPKGVFFSETYVAYNLAARKSGLDAATQTLKICERSCFNPWEILAAAQLVEKRASSTEIIRSAVDGKLNLKPGQYAKMEEGLAKIREEQEKGTGKPKQAKTLAQQLQSARDQVETQDKQKGKTKSRNKREER